MSPDELIARLADYGSDPGDAMSPKIVLDASERIAAVYADMLQQGVGEEVVARAMMGATISFYDSIGLGAVLPALLRAVADKIDGELDLRTKN